MESSAVNIGTTGLLLGYVLLIIPIALILYFRVKLLKDLTVSLLRMTVQLLLVGFYLQFVFDLNSWWLNILWLMAIGIGVQGAWEASLLVTGIRPAMWQPIVINSLIETNLGMPFVYFIHRYFRRKSKADLSISAPL